MMSSARWQINDNDDALSLQIELGNDHAVMLTIRKDHSEPNATMIRTGSGEHSFADETPAAFKAWLREASRRTR
jgi:hypothetical protein